LTTSTFAVTVVEALYAVPVQLIVVVPSGKPDPEAGVQFGVPVDPP
jgi:hypothetical protein